MNTDQSLDPAERFRALEAECRKELEQTREQLTEIELLIKQSNSEADKLGQREGAITTRVRDMEINLENYTRSDIKTLYTSAQEVNLRLFMMRGQVEQLQMRHEHVKERQEHLSLILTLLANISATSVEVSHATSTLAAASGPAHPTTASLSRIIEAQESERQRVSRYLHDGPAQILTNLVLRAEICHHLIDRDTTEAKAELQTLRASLTDTLQETRRLIFDLRPMILDDIGLVPTLRRYLTEIGRGRGFTHTVRGPESDDQLPPHVRALLFRLVQDLVAGMATRGSLEQVTIDLVSNAPSVELTVEARAAADAPAPAFDEVLAQDEVAQRLQMLAASTQVATLGERGAHLVVTATPPAV
jgi:two-component system sensor histidine kinase DegS